MLVASGPGVPAAWLLSTALATLGCFFPFAFPPGTKSSLGRWQKRNGWSGESNFISQKFCSGLPLPVSQQARPAVTPRNNSSPGQGWDARSAGLRLIQTQVALSPYSMNSVSGPNLLGFRVLHTWIGLQFTWVLSGKPQSAERINSVNEAGEWGSV